MCLHHMRGERVFCCLLDFPCFAYVLEPSQVRLQSQRRHEAQGILPFACSFFSHVTNQAMLIEPGSIVEYELDLWGPSNVFPRIRPFIMMPITLHI